MDALLGLIDHLPDLAHAALGVRTGGLGIAALQDAQGRVWSRAALQAGLAALPQDPSVPASVPPGLPQPGPTDHGLASLGVAGVGVSALVAAPPTRRIDGAWELDPAGVVRGLGFLAAQAGTAPLVVLLPWEWHQGPGDGHHPVAAAIADLARRPRTTLVAPTGNHGGRDALWSLTDPTTVDWVPLGRQSLSLWASAAGTVRIGDAAVPLVPSGDWWTLTVQRAEPVRLHVAASPACPVRLRPPFPSTGSLRCDPPAVGLGAVGFPAAHPGVVAVGAEHWMSARGLGGPDVLAPWSARVPVRAGPEEPCDLWAERRGASIAAALQASRLLAEGRDLPDAWVHCPT